MNSHSCFLIDDDNEDAEIFGYALDGTGLAYTLHTASNGTTAIEYLNSVEPLPDFIFMDLVMPGMPALECLATMRGMPLLGKIPIIVTSSSNYLPSDEQVLKSNATHFFVKPVNIDYLTRILVKILSGEGEGFVLE
jgi:CheY-like chemotaxis protein